MGEFEYMKEALTTDLAEMLMRKYHLTLSQALDAVFTSDTFSKLSNPDTGLYYQSSGYVFSYLSNELATGSMS